MAKHDVGEHPFPSTTWEWRRVKVRRPAGGKETAVRSTSAQKAGQRQGWRNRAVWPRHRSLSLSLTYRGGPECYWLVESRGTSGVFPGHMAIEDIMRAVLNER